MDFEFYLEAGEQVFFGGNGFNNDIRSIRIIDFKYFCNSCL
jgi:hypothetical protein